jgi:hypothetical protein
MEQELDLPVIPDDTMKESICTNHSNIDGWLPDAKLIMQTTHTDDDKQVIRSKYPELEINNTTNPALENTLSPAPANDTDTAENLAD